MLFPAALVAASVAAQEPSAEPGPEETPAPSVETLRAARDSLIEAADFSAALEPAERIVAELEGGGGSEELGRDLLSLARVEAGLEDFEAAERDYLRAIEILRDEDGSPRVLIAADRALGRVYISSRRFSEAIAVLEEARALSRSSEGLFNVGQSDVIDDLTLAHLGVGDTATARELQQERLENAERRFGADDARVIPFLSHLGDYYDRSRLRASAREQYARALAISAREFGVGDPSSLGLLRKLAAIDLALGEPSEIRERLAAIIDSGDEIDPVERGLTLAVLGDWALVHDGLEAARGYYREAYAALADVDPGNAADYFSAPRMIDFVPPLTAVDRATRRDPWTWGGLIIEFDVGADGRAYDVSTASMEPRQTRIASAYARRIRETHFRPRLRDGQPVATTGVRYSQSFRYYVDD